MYKTFALLAALVALSNGSSTKSLRVRSFLEQRGDSANDKAPRPRLGEDNEKDLGDKFDSKPNRPVQEHEFGHGDFNGTDFEHRDFNGTDFEHRDFNHTDFNGTDFEHRDFNGTDFDFGDFNGTEFNGTDFKHRDFNGTDFEHRDFNGTDFDFGDFNGTDFNGTDFKHRDFNGTDFEQRDFNGTDFNGTDFEPRDFKKPALIDTAFEKGDFNGTDFGFGDFNGTDFEDVDFNGTDFENGDFNGTEFEDGEFNGTEYDEDYYEWVDPKLPSEYYTYGDLLDAIIDSAEDVVDTASDLKRLQDRLVSSVDDIRLALISVALDDDEAAFDVLSDIEECVEDEEVYDDSDDSKIWGIVNSCWNIRPEEFAANLLAYNTYWVLYAVDACHGVDVEYKEVIGTFYQNPEDEFKQAVEHEVEEGTDNTVLLSLKDFATSKISKINLLQQAPREERDEDDIVNELETLYSDVVEEIYRSCYEAYELRNELRDNLYEAYYPAYHLPYPDEEPSDEVLEAYAEVLSE